LLAGTPAKGETLQGLLDFVGFVFYWGVSGWDGFCLGYGVDLACWRGRQQGEELGDWF
jgi:hypothetical protein